MARQQGFLGGRCYIVRSKDNGARSKIAFMEIEWLDWDLWELLFCCDTPWFQVFQDNHKSIEIRYDDEIRLEYRHVIRGLVKF